MLLEWCWFLQRYEKTDWSCMQLVPHSSTSPQYVQRGESRSQKNVFLSHMVTGISLAGSVTQLWKSLHPWSRRDIKRGSGATGSHLEWKLTESNKIWNFMSYEFVINSIYRYLPNMFYSVHLIISTFQILFTELFDWTYLRAHSGQMQLQPVPHGSHPDVLWSAINFMILYHTFQSKYTKKLYYYCLLI